MNKIESIKYLESLGMNTPRILLEIPMHMAGGSREAMIFHLETQFGKDISKVSIRTQRNQETKCPHHPNVDWDTARSLVGSLSSYDVFVFEGIDPALCSVKGNIVVDQRGGVILEYREGPGTVREMDSQEIKSLRFENGQPMPSRFNSIILPYFLKNLHQRILEWSIYSTPVGLKKENEIFWELREWK